MPHQGVSHSIPALNNAHWVTVTNAREPHFFHINHVNAGFAGATIAMPAAGDEHALIDVVPSGASPSIDDAVGRIASGLIQIMRRLDHVIQHRCPDVQPGVERQTLPV